MMSRPVIQLHVRVLRENPLRNPTNSLRHSLQMFKS